MVSRTKNNGYGTTETMERAPKTYSALQWCKFRRPSSWTGRAARMLATVRVLKSTHLGVRKRGQISALLHQAFCFDVSCLVTGHLEISQRWLGEFVIILREYWLLQGLQSKFIAVCSAERLLCRPVSLTIPAVLWSSAQVGRVYSRFLYHPYPVFHITF